MQALTEYAWEFQKMHSGILSNISYCAGAVILLV